MSRKARRFGLGISQAASFFFFIREFLTCNSFLPRDRIGTSTFKTGPKLYAFSNPETLSEDLRAQSQGLPSLGYSFSPGGLLFPYQLGVAKALIDSGCLAERNPVAGSSAGALVAACIGAGVDFDQAFEGCWSIIKECAEKGGARYNVREALDRQLTEMLPVEAHELLNLREGSVGFAITQFEPFPRGKIITEFQSRSDVVEVLLASCCVPFWFTQGPAVLCRGRPSIDGFFAFERQEFGCPRLDPYEALTTVRISPFPSSTID